MNRKKHYGSGWCRRNYYGRRVTGVPRVERRGEERGQVLGRREVDLDEREEQRAGLLPRVPAVQSSVRPQIKII